MSNDREHYWLILLRYILAHRQRECRKLLHFIFLFYLMRKLLYNVLMLSCNKKKIFRLNVFLVCFYFKLKTVFWENEDQRNLYNMFFISSSTFAPSSFPLEEVHLMKLFFSTYELLIVLWWQIDYIQKIRTMISFLLSLYLKMGKK